MTRLAKTTRVLVAGWIGSENTGDEAIFSALLSDLKKLGAEVTAFSINEPATKKNHKVKTAPFEIFSSPLKFLRAIKKTDVLIVGGGGILQDQTSIFNTPRYLYKAALGILLGKKVIFYGVGVGPLNFKITKILLLIVLNRTMGITVRDEASKKLLVAIGVNEALISVSFDPVISLPSISAKKSDEIFESEVGPTRGKKVIGISLRHWFDINPFVPVSLMKKFNLWQKSGKENYERFVYEMAAFLDKVNYKNEYVLFFIPYWYSRDSKVHADIIDKMKNKNNIKSLTRPYQPEALLGLFSKLDYIIGMRLHSCIYAANVGTPFMSVIYSSKVRNFLDSLNMGQWGIDIEQITSVALQKKFTSLTNNSNVSKKMRKAVSDARKKESLNMLLLKKVIKSN